MRCGRAAEASGEPVTVLLSRDDDEYMSPSFLCWLYHTLGYAAGTCSEVEEILDEMIWADRVG
jgi:hypothetical protein